MVKKTIIFDFDGTIADTLDPLLKIVNRLAKSYGYPKIAQEDEVALRNDRSQAIIKYFPVSKYRLPFFIRRVKREMYKNMNDVHPIVGLSAVLRELKADGYRLGIVTSNSRQNVDLFLQQHKLAMFDFIHPSSIFGKSKTLLKVMRQLNLNPHHVLYVGDETRDIEAAHKAGVKVISVTWGLNSKHILSTCNPDFLIDEPKQLLSTLK